MNNQNDNNTNFNLNGMNQGNNINNTQSQNIQSYSMHSTDNMQYSQSQNQQLNNFNPAHMNNNNLKNGNKNNLLIVIIIILVIIAISIFVINSGNKNNNSSNTGKSSDIINNSSNDNNSNTNTSSNNSSNNNANLSDEPVNLNTYGTIADNIEFKVNNVEIKDKFSYLINATFKNKSSNDVILTSDDKSIAYYEAYFIYKNADFDNLTDEDLHLEPCFLKEITQENGTKIKITSSLEENVMLKSGEEINAVISCKITGVKDYANGVEPGILLVKHYIDSTKRIDTYFKLR